MVTKGVISVATMVTEGEIEVAMMVKRYKIQVLMMTDVDLSLKLPYTLPLETWKKLLTVIEEVDIGPIPATLPPITNVTTVDCCLYLLITVMSMIVFMRTQEVIFGVITEDVEVGLKRSCTITLKVTQKLLIAMKEVDIGFRPSPLPPIIQASLIYYWVLIFVVTT